MINVMSAFFGSNTGSRHRDVQGGAARAAVLGAGAGLITDNTLVLGVAGAFSMAAGELVSVRAQNELVQREIQIEKEELRTAPEAELRELAAMYQARGVPADDAETVARILSANDKVALDTHARLELGVDPDAGGTAVQASVASFLSFAIGAVLPLLPWFFTHGAPAVVLSIVIGGLAALGLGAAIGSLTGQGVVRTAFRQLAAAAVAAAITFGVGSLLGVSTS